MNPLRHKRLTLGLIAAMLLPASLRAQVVGLQPTPQAMYTWNSTTNQWDKVLNSNTGNPAPRTPQAFAAYGWNAALGQWTPCNTGQTTSPCNGSGSAPSGQFVEINPTDAQGVNTAPGTAFTFADASTPTPILFTNNGGWSFTGAGILDYEASNFIIGGSGGLTVSAPNGTMFSTGVTANSFLSLMGPLNANGTPGTSTYVLTSNGPGVAPTWQAPSGGGGSACTSPCILWGPATTQVVTQPVVSTVQTTLATNSLNNFYYVSQFQTGGGNNGIANVAALNPGTGITGIVDPGYASTEVFPGDQGNAYGLNSLAGSNPIWPSLTSFQDNRVGMTHLYYSRGGTAQFVVNPEWSEFYYNDYQVTGPTLSFQNSVITSIYNGLGQQINGPFGGVNLKTYWAGNTTNFGSAAQGQHLANTTNVLVTGIGDVVNGSNTVVCDGGASTYNDVGCHQKENSVTGDHVIPTGTVTGQVSPFTIQVNLGSTIGHEGDGRFLIDLTGVIAGTGYPSQYFLGNFNFPPSSVTPWGQNGPVAPEAQFVGTSFTPSTLLMVCTTAFGGVCPQTTAANPSGTINSVSGGYAPGQLTVQVVTAAPGLPTGYQVNTTGFSTDPANPNTVCVADNEFFESTTAYAIDSTHLSVNFTKPHFNGATVSKGGTPGCNYGFENVGQTFQYNGAGQKYMVVWPVIGALDSTDLLIWDHNPQQNWSHGLTSNNSAGYCKTEAITITNVATNTVTFVDNVGMNPKFYNNPVVISTANATYNGTFTLTAASIFNNGQPNQPAYVYTASAISGTNPGTGTATICNQNFNFYPMAEVLDVKNPVNNQIDGYFAMAQYNVSGMFATGHTVSEPHYFVQYINESVAGDGVFQQLPQPAYVGVTTNGYYYGDTTAGNFIGFDIKNTSDLSLYQGYGSTGNGSGLLVAPASAYQASGPWASGFLMTTPPNTPGIGGGAVMTVLACRPAPIGCVNPVLSPWAIYSGPTVGGKIYDNPVTNSIVFGNSIGLGGSGAGNILGAFIMTLYDPVYGVIAVSQDEGTSLTPSGRFEGSGFHFYGGTPPTGFQPIEMYGDTPTSIGLRFIPTGSSTAFNGGTFTTAGYGFYVTSTTTALRTAWFSPTATVGQISCDDATFSDSLCTFLAANVTLSNTITAATYKNSAGVTLKASSFVPDVSVTVPALTVGPNVCYGSAPGTPASVTMTGLTTSMAVAPGYTANAAAIVGWGTTGGLNYQAWTSATNTFQWQVCNPTAASITMGSSITFLVAAN